MQYDPFEQEYILKALLSYAEMGNTISKEIDEILIQELEMHPWQTALNLNQPSIVIWIHASIFSPSFGMVLDTPESVAMVLYQAFEGEYYCTLNPVDRGPLKKDTERYLLTLAPNFSLSQAIQLRHIDLQQTQEIQESEFNIFFRVKKLFVLCQKVNDNTYSNDLKIFILLELYYQIYCLVKRSVQFENKDITEKMFNRFERGINNFLIDEGYSADFHEILMVLSSVAFYDRFIVKQDEDYPEKALCFFNILRSDMKFRALFKRPWMQEIRLTLFKVYYIYSCGQKEAACLENAVNHLLERERGSAGVFIWLKNAGLLPKGGSIFFDHDYIRKDPENQYALENETARSIYMTEFHHYLASNNPIDSGIEKMLVEIFKMCYVKIVWESMLEAPIWINKDLVQNNRLCIDSEDRVGKILFPTYAGETYFSTEVLQGKIPNNTVFSAILCQCNNYLLDKTMQSLNCKNLLHEKVSVENTVKLSISLEKTKLDLKQITLQRSKELENRKDVSIPAEQVIDYLLILGENIIEKIEITEGIIIFLLNIYYVVYSNIEKISDGFKNLQALKYKCALGLKTLLTVSEGHVHHQEIVYMLLCGIFQAEKQIMVVNKKNKFDTVGQFFAKAITHHFKHVPVFQLPWVNSLRKTVLEQIFLKEFSKNKVCSMQDIVTHILELGNKESHECFSTNKNSILAIAKRPQIELAIYYYSIILWMADVRLLRETSEESSIVACAKSKSISLKECLEKSKQKERVLLLTSAVIYTQAGNPLTETLTTFINESPVLLKEVEHLLKKRSKTSIKTQANDEEISLLLEMYEGLKDKPYDSLCKSIFKLDLYWHLYNRFNKVTLAFFDNDDSICICELSIQVENFIITQERTIFYEIANILLFNIRILAAKKNTDKIYSKESIKLCFMNAIDQSNTLFFKSPWVKALRQDSVLLYINEFADIPAPKKCNSLKKVIAYLTKMEIINEHADILNWMRNTNMVTEKEINDNRTSPKKKIQSLEDVVIEFNDIVDDLKCPPLKVIAQKMKQNVLSPIQKEYTLQGKPKKQKEKSHKLLREKPIAVVNLEEQAKLRQQATEYKIEQAKEARAYRQTIAMQNQQNQEAQEAQERQKAAEAWRSKREEQARLKALKEPFIATKSEQNTKKIRDTLRIKSERKEEENKRIIAQKKAELKARQEEKDRLENLKLEQERIRHEKELEEQKIEHEKANVRILQQYHLMRQREKEKSIIERPLRSLRNFEIDGFSELELPANNQRRLKELIKITQEHKIAEIQLYGSYVVFLASLRLDLPIKKIRRPGDLDVRIEIEMQTLKEQLFFIQALRDVGYILKGYSEKEAKEKYLADYISEKQLCGFLNLTLSPPKEDKEAYELELAILFKNRYKANHNPFHLLNHYIKISNNQAAFDGKDIQARLQLAQDILKGDFKIVPKEMLDPVRYNVFNFFPRLFKNIQTWKDYFAIYHENIQFFLTNVKIIVRFFSARFALRKYKDCYLELVGLITQNQFSLPESKLIIKGFLLALLEVINVEALLHLQRDVFVLAKRDQDANGMTQHLQDNLSTFICVVHGDQDINKKVFKKFYTSLMETLIQHTPDEEIKRFLRGRQDSKDSVLCNMFKKPLQNTGLNGIAIGVAPKRRNICS